MRTSDIERLSMKEGSTGVNSVNCLKGFGFRHVTESIVLVTSKKLARLFQNLFTCLQMA